jgi:hypothetical protein
MGMYAMVMQNRVRRAIAYAIDGPYRNDKTMLELGNFKAISTRLGVSLEEINQFLQELETLGVVKIFIKLSSHLSNSEIVIETLCAIPLSWVET